MATREDDLNELTKTISMAMEKAHRLKLPTSAYILSMVLLEVSEAAKTAGKRGDAFAPIKRNSLDRGRSGQPICLSARAGGASVPIDPDNPALFDRERQSSLFQRQGGVAKQLAAPAVQRADVGMIVSRDLFQIVDSCDHLAGDGVALRRHPQQDFQELDDRRTI